MPSEGRAVPWTPDMMPRSLLWARGQPICLRSVEEWRLPSGVGVLPLIFPLAASCAVWRLFLVLQSHQTCLQKRPLLPPWFSHGVLPCACAVLCSVVAGSLRPHGLKITRLLCPWASLGKNTFLEWVVISSSRGSSRPTDCLSVSCIGRWVLYYLCHLGTLCMIVSTFLPFIIIQVIWG